MPLEKFSVVHSDRPNHAYLNPTRYKCRHCVVSIFTGRSSHIIIGPADKVGAIFANKEARAVGLSKTVKKAREDVNDSGSASGRDLAKPIVSNVTASAVQDNMDSPRAPSISEDNDQAQPDQKIRRLCLPQHQQKCIRITPAQ